MTLSVFFIPFFVKPDFHLAKPTFGCDRIEYFVCVFSTRTYLVEHNNFPVRSGPKDNFAKWESGIHLSARKGSREYSSICLYENDEAINLLFWLKIYRHFQTFPYKFQTFTAKLYHYTIPHCYRTSGTRHNKCPLEVVHYNKNYSRGIVVFFDFD